MPRPCPAIEITLRMPAEIAPAFRSAVDEFSNELGGRLEGSFSFAREQAITDAVRAFGILRATINARIPKGDPHYNRNPEDEVR